MAENNIYKVKRQINWEQIQMKNYIPNMQDPIYIGRKSQKILQKCGYKSFKNRKIDKRYGNNIYLYAKGIQFTHNKKNIN